MPEGAARTWRRLALLLLAACSSLQADLDLARAERSELDNGLTLLVLEEPALPVVSVQVVYRAGAKHEPAGGSGLAHFLEHMAFRATENFPDTDVVSRIYAVGGEWHAYTWLDQTTYYATVPREEWELLLAIEADRMARLQLPAADVEAERGAVLAEMHGYENDPAAQLQDHALYLSFLAHPYRNNTIGWESDVAGITHAELVDFYRAHYHPGNAVLAVVGDVDVAKVREAVQRHFGALEGRARSRAPRTVEPPQRGERRVRLHGPADTRHFRIAWRAPGVNRADFAAFLVLQEWLAGGSGVSFLQNDWGTPARPGSPLGQALAGARSWFPPSQQDYVFAVSGEISLDGDEAAAEAAVQDAIESLRTQLAGGGPAAEAALAVARSAVERELRFDVLTTEDAAHQLAFFAGMDALDVLTGLPTAVRAVTVEDVGRALDRYLGAAQRTIAWFVPALETAPPPFADSGSAQSPPAVAEASEGASPRPSAVEAARFERLPNGLPVAMQVSTLSATAHLLAVFSGPLEGAVSDQPGFGLSTLGVDLLPGELEPAIERLAAAAAAASPEASVGPLSGDPVTRLDQELSRVLGPAAGPVPERPQLLFVALAGDFDADRARTMLTRTLGVGPAAGLSIRPPLPAAPGDVDVVLRQAVAQEQLGYAARGPAPASAEAAAWRLALYVLSHDYEGRLGKEAISRKGLVYYIDSAFGGDRERGWLTLRIGVDPAKRGAMEQLLRDELDRLAVEPPSEAELEEARRHLVGRRQSAAQSNPELAGRLARDWLWFGEPLGPEDYEARLQGVSAEQVRAVLPAFTDGTLIRVRGPEPPAGN